MTTEASTRDMIPGFGAAVRKRREGAQLSLTQLADRAGTHFAALSKIELSQRAPSLNVARKIASALGVTIDVLLQDAAGIVAENVEAPKHRRGKR